MPVISKQLLDAFGLPSYRVLLEDPEQLANAKELRAKVHDLISRIFLPGDTWARSGKVKDFEQALRNEFPSHFKYHPDSAKNIKSLCAHAMNIVYNNTSKGSATFSGSPTAPSGSSRSSDRLKAKTVVAPALAAENDDEDAALLATERPGDVAAGKRRYVSPLRPESAGPAHDTASVGGAAGELPGAASASQRISSIESSNIASSAALDGEPKRCSVDVRDVRMFLQSSEPGVCQYFEQFWEAGLTSNSKIIALWRWDFEERVRWLESLSNKIPLTSLEIYGVAKAFGDYI